MFPKNIKRIMVFALILFGIILFFSTRGKTVKIETDTVKRSKIASYISTPGVITTKVADLGIPLGGRIVKTLAKEGDTVKPGQILALLDAYDQANRDYESTKTLFAKGFASRQQLENAKTIMEGKKIVAPIKGIVTRIGIEEGEIAPPGTPIITVVNLSSPWVEIQIDETDIAEAHIGQSANIISEAFSDQEFKGTLTWINYKTELKKTGGIVRPDEEELVFRAKVSLPEDAIKKIKPGMSVTVDLLIKERQNVLIVPRSSVFQDKKRETSVFLIKNGKAYQTRIEPGIKDPTNVEVLNGLSEKDIIATTNISELQDGIKVKTTPVKNNNIKK